MPGDLLLDPLLPPQHFTMSLPALSLGEAEMILQLVDQLHDFLWDAYGQAVTDQWAEDHRPEPAGPPDDAEPNF